MPSMSQRVIEQLSPIAPLLEELTDNAYLTGTVQRVAAAFPDLYRGAHLKRVAGTVRWAMVVDGLVDADADDRFPEGFTVQTTESQHDRGCYAFAFPGGVFALRRAPHDDEQAEGRFLQQSFEQVTKLMDAEGLQNAETAVRVWVHISPDGKTKLTARDRYGHESVVMLTQLLEALEVPAIPLPSPTVPQTGVRSTLKSAEQKLEGDGPRPNSE